MYMYVTIYSYCVYICMLQYNYSYCVYICMLQYVTVYIYVCYNIIL